MTTAVDPGLLALAAVGLDGTRPLPRQGWSGHLDEVFEHGLAGLLADAYHHDLVDLDDAACSRLRSRLESEAIRAVQLEGELIRLAPALEALDAVVLKGAVLAHGAYADPSLRPFTDLDILVVGDRHEEAVRTFAEFGYERSRPEPAPGYDSSIGKALTLVYPGGVVIDLHRTLVPGLAGASIRVEEILAERGDVEVNGRGVPAPSWDAHLVEVCLHAVVGDGLGRALSLRDIAEVLEHPEVQVDRALELARRWKVTSIVVTGVRAAADSFGIELPSQLVALVDKGRADAPPPPAGVRSSRSRLDELHGGSLRRRLTVARSLVAPSREFLRFTYGEHSTPNLYLRRWGSLFKRSLDAREPRPSAATPSKLPSLFDRHQPSPADPAVDATTRRPDAGPSAVVTRRPTGAVAPESSSLAARPPLTVVGRVPRAAVALARPGVGVATLAASGGPVAESLSAAVMPRIPSRQERWTEARPPGTRPSGRLPSPRDPGPPPPRPPFPSSADGPEASEPPKPVPAAVGTESGTPFCVGGIVALLTATVFARLGVDWGGIVFVPLGGILFAMALWRHLARVRPDEAWVGRWMLIGVVAKVAASYVRYLTLINSYNGVGDASEYDTVGREFAKFWMGNGPEPFLPDLRKTNFIRWFTGVAYYIFGSNIIAGFFVFGLLALIGSYLWYRATADSVPFLDKRLYLGLVLFAPSLAFWPSSIGKESLMQLALGVMAMAVAFFLRQRLLLGLLIGIPGGWLLWVVRPHLLAMAAIGATFAYVVGRVRSDKKTTGVGTRTIGLILVAFIMAFSLGQMMTFLGMKDLSLSSIDQTLNEQQQRTAQGGSSFDNGGDYLSPANLPRGFVTVLLRPFPWEVESPFQILASAESAAVAVLFVMRFSSVKTSLRRARGTPYLLYCWVFTFLFAASFASFANFGLLVRERSLVLPAFFVVLCLVPDRATEPTVDGRELGARAPVAAAGA